MDQKGTYTETSALIPLTSVQSGKECKLVGVSEVRRGKGKHGMREGLQSKRGKQHEHSEQQKENWHERGQRQIVKRLLDLGLTKGCTFKVIQGRGRGPVLVEVRGTRIALGHGLASKVIVEIMEEPK